MKRKDRSSDFDTQVAPDPKRARTGTPQYTDHGPALGDDYHLHEEHNHFQQQPYVGQPTDHYHQHQHHHQQPDDHSEFYTNIGDPNFHSAPNHHSGMSNMYMYNNNPSEPESYHSFPSEQSYQQPQQQQQQQQVYGNVQYANPGYAQQVPMDEQQYQPQQQQHVSPMPQYGDGSVPTENGHQMPVSYADGNMQNMTPGYQYLAYMVSKSGKYEPVLIYYDQNGQAQVQEAPELQEHLQAAMSSPEYQQYTQQIAAESYEHEDPAPATTTTTTTTTTKRKKKSRAASQDTGEDKTSVAELAKRVGLLKNEHKEWRFRDQKRTLVLKLTSAHQSFIENSQLDEILLRRLPHKITPSEFAKRIWLLVFHSVVAEGNTPKFWDRVADREYLEDQLDEEFKQLRNPQFASEVHSTMTKHDCSVEDAINNVLFQHTQQQQQQQLQLQAQQQAAHQHQQQHQQQAPVQQDHQTTHQQHHDPQQHQEAHVAPIHQTGEESDDFVPLPLEDAPYDEYNGHAQ